MVCKICNTCNVLLTFDNQYQFSKDAHNNICKKCHLKKRNVYRHKNGYSNDYMKNKSCSQFLGIHVAERVLKHVFNNIKEMPIHNPGYDFICGKGFKIDVKAACVSHNQWRFKTKGNPIPDYFLFLGFDNIFDLNPKHIWLMPIDFINNRYETSISLSQVKKWFNYELNINKIVNSCNQLKNGSEQYAKNNISSDL